MTEAEAPRKEQEHQRRAFEVYYAQRSSRSYEKVAREMEVSLPTVKLWGRKFHWRQRVQDRDIESARRIADRTLQSAAEDQERYHKIVRMAVMKLAKGIAEDRVKLQAADLDRLIRLEDYLTRTREGGRMLDHLSSAKQIADYLERLGTSTLRHVLDFVRAQNSKQGSAAPVPGALYRECPKG